jgi:hypothetical protein
METPAYPARFSLGTNLTIKEFGLAVPYLGAAFHKITNTQPKLQEEPMTDTHNVTVDQATPTAPSYAAWVNPERVAGFIPQKIMGLEKLSGLDLRHPFSLSCLNNFFEDDDKDPRQQIAWFLNRLRGQFHQGAIFYRPCPSVPRHGFLDSEAVALPYPLREAMYREFLIDDVYNEIKRRLGRVLEVDPNGALLVMPFIDADYNAVISPAGLTIGPGHDGATNGRDSFTLPIAGFAPQGTFIEAVFSVTASFKTYATQARLGENLTPTLNLHTYIPPAPAGDASPYFEVHHIYTLNPDDTDMYSWPDLLGQLAPNTVIHHPGGSTNSHWGYWVVVKGEERQLAYTTTAAPRVGQMLLREDRRTPDDASAGDFVRGLTTGLSIPINRDILPDLARAAILLTHGAASLRANGQLAPLGWAAALLLRLGTALALGEARHFRGNKQTKSKSSRSKVYARTLADYPAYLKARGKLSTAAHQFAYGRWSGGFGGSKWLECATSILDLDRHLTTLYTILATPHPLGERLTWLKLVDETMLAAHIVLNKAHNNGWWFNKIVQIEHLHMAANNMPAAVLDSLIGITQLYNTHQYLAAVGARLPKALPPAAAAPAIPGNDKPLTITEATLHRDEDSLMFMFALTLSNDERIQRTVYKHNIPTSTFDLLSTLVPDGDAVLDPARLRISDRSSHHFLIHFTTPSSEHALAPDLTLNLTFARE